MGTVRRFTYYDFEKYFRKVVHLSPICLESLTSTKQQAQQRYNTHQQLRQQQNSSGHGKMAATAASDSGNSTVT